MSKLFFPKLSITTIKKNGKFYFPYILTCIFTVAMFYIMCFIKTNEGIKKMPGADALESMMGAGTFVIALFAVIFLFYTNSFLIKRRKKELGLYNILGMEKRHIAKILFFETAITGVVSIITGLFLGILLSKLIFMLFSKLLDFPVPFGFSISTYGIKASICLFSAAFILILLSNLWQIKLAKPIELLRGGNVGEKEPKTKAIMAIAGAISLGIGYYIALTTETPTDAISLFLVAVVLVIMGTYFLFNAGSIALLKLLRKNKKYYYQTKHFTSVSGMLYRMKQNAVGLANICILSTMVLVMVSGTVSLYLGAEDAIDNRYPHDITVIKDAKENNDRDRTIKSVLKAVSSKGRTIKKLTDYEYLVFTVSYSDGQFITNTKNQFGSSGTEVFCFITSKEYEHLTGKSADISGYNVLSYSSNRQLGDNFTLFGKTYTVKNRLDSFPSTSDYAAFLMNVHYVVLSSDALLSQIMNAQLSAYGENASSPEYEISLDIDGTNDEKIACADAVDNATREKEEYTKEDGSISYRYVNFTESRQKTAKQFYVLYGGFLFLGLFLGTLFMMATALIIYYKQISEGYDDKERFEIMKKVGMSHDEIKSTVRSQVLKVFFLPIAAAAVHIAAAFKMITKLLALMNLTNVTLFFWCTVGTLLVFAAIYGLVYALTAKIYYKIVE
ncbi:ABC transporter permease [Acetivibrio cellulolyticus]|uniref:ABC transporter permease n=1 Tax=Acetivibrio cellulolyticus TaxID=35830 RepID=UPI0002481B2C|nr:ABC transporter permease [Acetivibrio cellulolyticus]